MEESDPIQLPGRALDARGLAAHGHSMAAPPKLLVIDDDPALLASLKFSFELEGFEVAVFDSGEALLAHQSFPDPDCFVIDYRLPGIDGLKLLRMLRERGATCPAVLITSNPTRSVQQRTTDAGALLIEKPLLGDGLSLAIRRLIERSKEPH